MRVALLFLLAMGLPASSRAQAPTPHGTGHSMAWGSESFLLADLSFRVAEPSRSLDLDLSGWVGNATRRWWFGVETEPDAPRSGLDLALSHGWLVAPYWDLLVGGWVDLAHLPPSVGDMRGGPAIGLHGLAPGWFDVEAALQLSARGDLAVRASAAYDLYLTQRLVVQPQLEGSWHPRPIRAEGVTAGISHAEAGLRARYELSRRFAPYVGVAWNRAVYDAGGRVVTTESALSVGIRAWR